MTLPPFPDRPLNICVYGAGAIGGVIAYYLARAASTGDIGTGDIGKVSIIARGDHLSALQTQGLRLRWPDGKIDTIAMTDPITATNDPKDLPPQDIVITALKGHQIPPIARDLAALLEPHGRVVPVVNGVPWWYPIPDGKGGSKGVEAVDPGGVLWRNIGPERAIGAIAYLGAAVPEPGLISYDIQGYLDLGRLPGQDRNDVERLAKALRNTGWMIRETDPFGQSLWAKLLANCAMNSVTAICRAPMAQIIKIPRLRAMSAAIMEEVRAIALAENAPIKISTEKRLELAGRDPHFKTSTLQDLEKGRPMEIEPIFAATADVGRALGVPCPTLDLATEILRSIERDRGFA